MAISAFFFSIMGLLVKVAGERLPSQEIVFFRSLLVLIFAWWMLKRAGVNPWGNNKKWLVVRGFTGFMALSCFYYGVTHLPLADATLIMYSNPVFTALLAAVFLGERLKKVDLLGVVLSLGGVVLIAQPSFIFGGASRLDPFDVGVALAGAVFAAISYVIVRKLRESEHALVVVFYFPLIATPASIPTALPDAIIPTWWELGVLLAIGIVTHIAQVAMTKGLHLEEAGRATAVSYLQVVFAFVWGMFFFDEFPTVLSVIGALLIVGSTIAIALYQQKAAKDT
ncbi:DMT family transporter [Persicimonas caeni]|uniref:DMT family transporter n=2 Tax=Persicimonas caeni TaxID=2292766 RepID=A0A4Y6Q2R5_PERCE|nr:DMT family transporter [Persicimonas caeni]QED36068.1 DMT family transporter [Persicimonas caeni]